MRAIAKAWDPSSHHSSQQCSRSSLAPAPGRPAAARHGDFHGFLGSEAPKPSEDDIDMNAFPCVCDWWGAYWKNNSILDGCKQPSCSSGMDARHVDCLRIECMWRRGLWILMILIPRMMARLVGSDDSPTAHISCSPAPQMPVIGVDTWFSTPRPHQFHHWHLWMPLQKPILRPPLCHPPCCRHVLPPKRARWIYREAGK